MAFSSTLGYGQVLDNIDFEKVIQDLLPQQEYDVDYNDLYDRLFSLYSSPLNLNTAGRADFQSLYFLSDEQISALLNYRDQYGGFKSIYELSTIEGFDRNTIEKLMTFARIEDNKSESLASALKTPSSHEIFLRYQTVVEKKKGYTIPDTLNSGQLTSRYAGDPGRLYARYIFAKPDRYSLGFTIEKDPGEKLIWDPNTKRYGMDYYSIHAMVENVWVFDKIVVGDFSLDFGQGLVFGSGVTVGKGTEPVTTIRRNGLGLKPYRSVYESKDFSGVASSLNLGIMNLTLFCSNVYRDASIQSLNVDDYDNFQFTSYINSIGLHRTASEIESKHSLSEKSAGGNLRINGIRQKLEIGLNSIYCEYDKTIIPSDDKYKLFQFRGKSNINSSIYVNYHLKKAHLFGETAISQNGGLAHSAGVILNLSSFIQTAIHFRNYEMDYYSITGNAFGENTIVGNEKGIFWGLHIRPSAKLLITTYFDYFSFPWLKYQVDAPSNGNDFLVSVNYKTSENSNLRLQYRDKTKSQNLSTSDASIVDIQSKRTSRVMIDFDYRIDPSIGLKTWVQSSLVRFGHNRYSGFFIAQDLIYKMKKWSMAGRFALFDADDYDSRIYVYERDMLYVYSVPAFFNKGVRYYVLLKHDISRHISLWLKYAQTKYYNIEKIGSGLEEIDGDVKANLSVQMKIIF